MWFSDWGLEVGGWGGYLHNSFLPESELRLLYKLNIKEGSLGSNNLPPFQDPQPNQVRAHQENGKLPQVFLGHSEIRGLHK